jgi:hypothetical protein
MEPRGNEGNVVVFHVHLKKDIRKNCKETYELWGERKAMTKINIDAKLMLNLKNYILKSKRISPVEIYEIKENIRLKIWNVTEEHTKGMNGDKMGTNDKDHQQRDQESNNTGSGKTENNKHPGAEGEQQTVSNKLQEHLQIMWHTR